MQILLTAGINKTNISRSLIWGHLRRIPNTPQYTQTVQIKGWRWANYNGPHSGQILCMIWEEDLAAVHIRLSIEAWRLAGHSPKEKRPLCVYGNCMANSLLLCCQEATGDRTRDALRGFMPISCRYTHHCSWAAIKLQGGRTEESRSRNQSVIQQPRGCVLTQEDIWVPYHPG